MYTNIPELNLLLYLIFTFFFGWGLLWSFWKFDRKFFPIKEEDKITFPTDEEYYRMRRNRKEHWVYIRK